MLGKNPTSVQNTITFAQKKDAELHIIEGLLIHAMKLTTLLINKSIIKKTLDPAMLVVAPSLYETAMN